MRTREQLISLRIVHVTIMFATALLIYQFSQWDDGLWLPISVLAIIGPFRPGMSINKAQQRVLGSLAGLFLSLIIWVLLYYNYNLLVIIALVLIYCVAFSVLQDYSYFIMLVTIMLCLNFDYMNLFFNNEISYLANRGMCVLAGVTLCQFYEYFVFRHYYADGQALVEKEKLDLLLIDIWHKVNQMGDQRKIVVADLNECIAPLLSGLSQLAELKESCRHGYNSQQQTLALAEHYEVKLQTMYNWLSTLGFKLITINPRLAINDDAILLPAEVEN